MTWSWNMELSGTDAYNETWFNDYMNNSIWQQRVMATLRANGIYVIRLDQIITRALAYGIQRQQL